MANHWHAILKAWMHLSNKFVPFCDERKRLSLFLAMGKYREWCSSTQKSCRDRKIMSSPPHRPRPPTTPRLIIGSASQTGHCGNVQNGRHNYGCVRKLCMIRNQGQIINLPWQWTTSNTCIFQICTPILSPITCFHSCFINWTVPFYHLLTINPTFESYCISLNEQPSDSYCHWCFHIIALHMWDEYTYNLYYLILHHTL